MLPLSICFCQIPSDLLWLPGDLDMPQPPLWQDLKSERSGHARHTLPRRLLYGSPGRHWNRYAGWPGHLPCLCHSAEYPRSRNWLKAAWSPCASSCSPPIPFAPGTTVRCFWMARRWTAVSGRSTAEELSGWSWIWTSCGIWTWNETGTSICGYSFLIWSHSAAAKSFKFNSVHLALNGCHLRGARSGSAAAQAGSLLVRCAGASDRLLPAHCGVEHRGFQQRAFATWTSDCWSWRPYCSFSFAPTCCLRSLQLFGAPLQDYFLVLDHGRPSLLLHCLPQMRPSKARSSHFLVPLNSKHHLVVMELSGQGFVSASL